MEGSKMTQQTNSDGLTLILRTSMVEGENRFLQATL